MMEVGTSTQRPVAKVKIVPKSIFEFEVFLIPQWNNRIPDAKTL